VLSSFSGSGAGMNILRADVRRLLFSLNGLHSVGGKQTLQTSYPSVPAIAVHRKSAKGLGIWRHLLFVGVARNLSLLLFEILIMHPQGDGSHDSRSWPSKSWLNGCWSCTCIPLLRRWAPFQLQPASFRLCFYTHRQSNITCRERPSQVDGPCVLGS
jgi:hypothetical protein